MGSIFKRKSLGGTLTYTARVRRRGFPHITATFSRLTDAKSWIEQEETKIRQGVHLDYVEAKKHTLAEALERYVSEEKPNSTRVTHLKRWKQTMGPLLLSAVTEIGINEVTSRWKNMGLDGIKFGPATLNRHLNSLSILFRAGKEWGWVTRNPVQEARKYAEPRGRVRFLSDDERKRLLEVCRLNQFKKIYPIVVLALSTGMRKEEILSLKWSQVDLDAGTIILTKTKNNERRRVAVTSLALTLLTQHAKTRRLDSQFVFPGERVSFKSGCKVISLSDRHYDIKRPWMNLLLQAGVRDFTFHDLRHSCASYLAMNGATSLEIAEVLGHKSLDVVKRYAHLSESHVNQVVQRMNDRFIV